MIEPAVPTDFWGHYPLVSRPTRPPTWLGGAGGLSGSDLWRVEATSGPLMLRRWPADGPGPARLHQIHTWLARLVPYPWVAIPLADQHGRTVRAAAGRFWEVGRFLPGQADADRPASLPHLAAMFAALAWVHGGLGPATVLEPSPGLIARRDELARLIAREFESLRRAVRLVPCEEARWSADRWIDLASGVAPRIVERLERAARRVLPLQPVLRDVRPDHFLFDGDRLTGLVDFGAMGVDSVASDLARLLGEAVGRSEEHRRAAFAAYETVRPISAEIRAVVADFEAANAVLGGARWVRWHFVDRRSFADPGMVERGLNRTLVRLDEWNRSPG